jgi:hypothetical protein
MFTGKIKLYFMRKTKWFLPLVAFALLSSCSTKNSSSLYVPSNSDVTANATLAELEQGRTLYINNCGSCHGLYSPDNYSPSQWNGILSSMTPKTSLTSAQVTLVKKYVTRGQ